MEYESPAAGRTAGKLRDISGLIQARGKQFVQTALFRPEHPTDTAMQALANTLTAFATLCDRLESSNTSKHPTPLEVAGAIDRACDELERLAYSVLGVDGSGDPGSASTDLIESCQQARHLARELSLGPSSWAREPFFP